MNDISVNKYKIQDVLYYENEPLLSITINYPYDIAPYSSGITTFTFPYENTNVIEPYCVKD